MEIVSDFRKQSDALHERCEDVSQAGVLLALPALLACGLLRHSAKYFHLPEGCYILGNIFLLLGLMILNRVKSVEELRRSAPRGLE